VAPAMSSSSCTTFWRSASTSLIAAASTTSLSESSRLRWLPSRSRTLQRATPKLPPTTLEIDIPPESFQLRRLPFKSQTLQRATPKSPPTTFEMCEICCEAHQHHRTALQEAGRLRTSRLAVSWPSHTNPSSDLSPPPQSHYPCFQFPHYPAHYVSALPQNTLLPYSPRPDNANILAHIIVAS